MAAAQKTAPAKHTPPVLSPVPIPPFWKVRLADIEETVRNVKVGKVSVIARSPGGHPVYAVAYGTPNLSPATTNFSGALGAGHIPSFKDEAAGPQSIILVAGSHGSEPEGTAALVNLIQMVETGKDYCGQTDERLLELFKKYRVVIIPCHNPDGRHRSPDSLNGADIQAARAFMQGTWKDGTPIGWPACKRYQPLDPKAVASLGGYPNDDGYNLMHDAAIGDIRTDEVRGLLKLILDERADLVVHFHSHQTDTEILPPSMGMLDTQRQQILAYRKRLYEFLSARNLPVTPISTPDGSRSWVWSLNLATLTSLGTGALSPVIEQSDGAGKEKPDDFDEKIRTTYASIEMFLQYGQDEPFAPREQQGLKFFDSSVPLIGHGKFKSKD